MLRRFSNYKTTRKCSLRRQELVVSLLRGRSAGNVHQKLHYTTYNEKDTILEEKGSSSLDLNPSLSNSSEETSASASGVKVHSGFAEYTLNDDGYLDIKDLVDFLKKENAIDICVIRTSEDKRNYVDYFVVVCGVSSRHLRAMAKNLEQLFRGHEVRGIGRDGHVVVEGLESDHWLALDIGNIVVHFFLPEVREVYELEKLWTLGPKYDDQSKDMQEREKFLRAAEFGRTLEENVSDTDG